MDVVSSAEYQNSMRSEERLRTDVPRCYYAGD
jgi:hypothetical protein